MFAMSDYLTDKESADLFNMIRWMEWRRAIGKPIYPARENVFRAIELCPPEKAKVVIIGQMPTSDLHDWDGLLFSSQSDGMITASQKAIFEELERDTGDIRNSGDLTEWAKQGVLLLNTVLATEEQVGQYKTGTVADFDWHPVTTAMLRASITSKVPTCFLVWGEEAFDIIQEVCVSIGHIPANKCFLCSLEPNRDIQKDKKNRLLPEFEGSKPFSKANEFLSKHGEKHIIWKGSDVI